MGKKSRRKRLYPLHPPVQNAAIMEAVSHRDRRFFEGHPFETHYVRPYIPGEFPPAAVARAGESMPDQDDWVLVTRVAPGSRTRQPLGIPDLQRWNGNHVVIGLTNSDEIVRAFIWRE